MVNCNVFGKISRLAVKLAKEAYFGPEVMKNCTIKGKFNALPQEELSELKQFLENLCIPRLCSSKIVFESLWKTCCKSIGQACKQLRNP